MTAELRKRTAPGLILFLVFTFLGSSLVAATFRVFDWSTAPAPIGTRLFTTSLLYAATMGWQPLVATWMVRAWVDPPERADLGLRPARYPFGLVGGAGAVAFVAAAMAGAWLLSSSDPPAPPVPGGTSELGVAASTPSGLGLALLLLAFGGAVFLVWCQAFIEELGWRGYLLPTAMEMFGKWRGLILHGALWGLWYAPVPFFATYGHAELAESALRGLAFVVSCTLIGVLFGWLRLAARSVAPVVIANTTLTLGAGLPYVVQGLDVGTRSAAFGPVGWCLLGCAIAALLASRWTSVVRIPERVSARGPGGGLPLAQIWVIAHGPPPGGPGGPGSVHH